MKSVATRRFWTLFHSLPAEVQERAVKNYDLWLRNPNHPSLHFRRLQGSKDRFTVRVGEHHRAVGRLDAGIMTWVWIGTHAEYDQLVP